jgi:hypothetical protein
MAYLTSALVCDRCARQPMVDEPPAWAGLMHGYPALDGCGGFFRLVQIFVPQAELAFAEG